MGNIESSSSDSTSDEDVPHDDTMSVGSLPSSIHDSTSEHDDTMSGGGADAGTTSGADAGAGGATEVNHSLGLTSNHTTNPPSDESKKAHVEDSMNSIDDHHHGGNKTTILDPSTTDGIDTDSSNSNSHAAKNSLSSKTCSSSEQQQQRASSSPPLCPLRVPFPPFPISTPLHAPFFQPLSSKKNETKIIPNINNGTTTASSASTSPNSNIENNTTGTATTTAIATTTATDNVTAPVSSNSTSSSSTTSPVNNTATRDTNGAGKSQASTKHRLEVASPVTATGEDASSPIVDNSTIHPVKRSRKNGATPDAINRLKKSRKNATTTDWRNDKGDDDRNKENATSVRTNTNQQEHNRERRTKKDEVPSTTPDNYSDISTDDTPSPVVGEHDSSSNGKSKNKTTASQFQTTYPHPNKKLRRTEEDQEQEQDDACMLMNDDGDDEDSTKSNGSKKDNDFTINNAAAENSTEHNPSAEDAINNNRTSGGNSKFETEKTKEDQEEDDASVSVSASKKNNEDNEGSTNSTGSNNSNEENTNEKVHAGSNLESVEIEEEQDQDQDQEQEQDDAVEEEKEDDDESVPVNNDGDDDLFIKSGSDDATRGNNSEIDDAGDCGQGERGSSPAASSNHDNEMTSDYSGDLLGDDGDTDNSGDFLDDDDDDDDDNHDSKRTTENSGDSLGGDGDDNNRTESKAKPIGSRPIAASTNTDDPDGHEIFTAASPDGTVPNSDASMVTDNTQHEADRQLDMASQSLESGTTRNMRTRSITEVQFAVEPVCRVMIKSYMIGDPRQFSEKNLHRLDEDEHAKLLLSLVNLVRYQNNDGDPKMFQNIISSLQRKGVNDAHGIIISILDAISNASYKDTKDGNIVKAVADHPAMSKTEQIQVIKHIGKQKWDRKKTQVIYVPDQLNPPWCEQIIENNEKWYLINKMILRSPGNEFIAVTKSKGGINNYQVEGDTNIKTWDELKTQFRDHKMFLVILTSDSKFVRVLVNSSAGFRPMRQEQFESQFGKPDKYADLVRTCMADASILALRYYGIKDDNGEDLSYETAREKCDLNGILHNISIDTVREFLLLYGFTHSRSLNQFKSHRKKGPKKNVFAETQGVYFVLVSYCAEDEDDWEASDDDRHVFLFCASERFLVDAYGCMKFTPEEGQDKAKMKQVMKEFLGEDVKYTIRNVWKIKQINTAAAPDSTVPNQNPSPSLTDRLAASTGSVVTTELLLNVTNSDNNNNGDNDDRSRVQDLLVSIMNILYMKKFSGATNIIGYLTNIRSADHLRGDNTEFKSIAAAFGALTVTGEARERVFNPDNAPMNTIVSFFVDNKITSVNGIIRTMIHIFKNTFNQKNKSVYEMLATITTVRIITDLELINDPESDEFDDGFFDYVLYLPTSNDSKMRFFPWKYPLINDHYYFIEAVLMRLPNGKLKICHAEGDHIQQHKFSIDDGNNSIVAAEWEVFRVHCEKNNFMIELIKMKKAPLYIQNNVVGARPVRPSQHPNVKIIGDDDFESEETEISCGPDGVGLAIMHMTGANITYSWVRQQMIACSSNGYRNIMDMTSILNAYGLEVRGSKRRVDNNIDVFKYSTGVYLFVFEFHDEADNSASTKKNRHTAVYIADERLITDNCGPATRLYPAEDIIDNDSIQVVMREKWGEHLTYNIIKICQIIKKGTAPNPAFIETFIEGPKIIKLAEGGKKGLDADNNSNKNKILCRLSLANSVREEVLLTVNPIDEGFVGGRNGNVLFTGREGNASQVLDGRYQKKYDNQSFSKKRDFLSIMLRRKDNNKSLFTSVFLCPFSGECFSSGNLLSVNDADIIHDTSSLNWYSTKKLAVLAAAARAEDNFFSRSSRQGDGKFNSINRTNTKQFCKEPTYSEESDVLLSLDRFKSIDNTAAEMINKLKHLIKARRN